MLTIPEIVHEIISSSPFLEESLADGIVNASALARKIRPQVEKRLLRKVKDGAIIMAIRRLVKTSYVENKENKLKKILSSNIDFIVRSNLVEYVISNADFSPSKHRKLIDLLSKHQSYFLTITEGVFETTIIASTHLIPRIGRILAGSKTVSRLSNLSSITMRLPEDNVYTPGVYYFFLKILAWENINVVEVVSTYTEFSVIIAGKEVDHAFSVLKNKLRNTF